MKRVLVAGLVACAAPPAPRPPSPSPLLAPAALAPPPLLPPSLQRFAESDPGFGFADPERRTKLAAAFPAIDVAVAEELASQDLPGLSLGIVIDGELAYAKGYGVANLETKAAPDADTVYRIGSITKSFTGLAILALRDDGALSLDDALVKWVPEASGLVYPSRDSRPITLRQLMSHTAGLPRGVDVGKGPTEQAIVKALDGLALETAPGTAWSYSNLGFALLGIVVGHASHGSLHDVLGKRVFGPLGMTSTAWARADVPAGRLAPSYDETPAGRVAAKDDVPLGAADGAGGIYSSVRDMARYVAFQLSAYPPRDGDDAGPVRRATIREAHSTGVMISAEVHTRPAAKPGEAAVSLVAQGYGAGWGHTITCTRDDLIEHNGSIESYRSDVELLTAHGVGVIVLTNFGRGNPSRVADRVVAELDRTGALQTYVAHPRPSPALEAAMTKLLAVYNTWDEVAFKAVLARPPQPEEPGELAGYKKLHGACSSSKLVAARSALAGEYALTCEHGTFVMSIEADAKGLVGGFTGTSSHVDVPPEIAKAGADATALLARWDDRVFARVFADPDKHRDRFKRGFDAVRAQSGACKLKEITHVGVDWKLTATCERGGDLVATMALTGGKIVRLDARPAAETTCPLR